MRPLRPFSGEQTRCPKCGWTGPVSFTYRSPGYCQEGPHETPFAPGEEPAPDRHLFSALDWMNTHPRPERLCRKCERCGCRWDEECVPEEAS